MSSLIIMIASLVLGFLIGCIPILGNYLHWQIFLVPLSGVIFGIFFGYFQALFARILKLNLARYCYVFALIAPLSYLALDYGHYFRFGPQISGSIHSKNENGDRYRLLSLPEFIEQRFNDSRVSGLRRDKNVDVINSLVYISFGFDMLSCFWLASYCIKGVADKHLSCASCGNYQTIRHTYNIWIDSTAKQFLSVLESIFAVCRKDQPHELVRYLTELSSKRLAFTGSNLDKHWISVKHWECPHCHAKHFFGTVAIDIDKSWEAIDELKFDSSYEGEVRASRKAA